MNDLRKALAHEALDKMVAENQKLGLYDDDLQGAIEKGTKAWADVPDATKWVEELRGNDTPEETPEVTPEVPCKTHPDAPHGFDRNASHSADRYVCECEGWEPPEWDWDAIEKEFPAEAFGQSSPVWTKRF